MINNPFLPYKYLHPRRSGMVVFKGGGGGTQSINVQGGLTDAQYKVLLENQDLIDLNVTGAKDLAKEGFADVNVRMDDFNTSANSNRDAITANTNTGFNNLSTLLEEYNTGQNQRFDTMDTNMASNATSLGDLGTGVTNLQSSQDTGFADMGTRFDTVDQANTTMQNDMTTGFQDTGTSLANMNTSMDTQFTDAQANRVANLGTTTDNMNAGFETVGDTLATNEAARAAGIDAIAGDVSAFSGRSDDYATQSLQNQEAMAGTQDGFVSKFDNYVDRYTDDVELAGIDRSSMQRANEGFNNQLRSDLGAYAQASSIGQQNLSDQFSAQQGGFQQTNQATADIYGGIDAGQIVEGRNIARQAANIPSLNPQMRMEFSEIGAAFDDNGQLIESTINSNGIRTNRRMDDRGNLILDQFNQQGQGIGRMNINIDQSINNLRSLAAIT